MKLPGIRSRKVAPSGPPEGECRATSPGASPREFPNLLSCLSSEAEAQGPGSEGRRASEAAPAGGVTRDDFEVIGMLGQGGFGEVKLVNYTGNGKLYAMKALEKSAILERRHFGDDGAQSRVQAERDIGVMASQWNCPFIIQLFATFQTQEKLYFVFEYCSQGDLFEHLSKQPEGRFDEPTARFYLAEVCLALEHLHSRDAIHRDVKLENMLLTSDGHVKLADFGIAKMNMSPEGARPSYCFAQGPSVTFYPPEYQQGDAYGKDLDCWQLGVAAFLMLSGCLPEPGAAPPGASEAAAALCRGLLAPERASRLGHPSGAGQLRSHAFFQDLCWSALEARALAPPGPAIEEAAPARGSPVRPTQSMQGRVSGLFRLPRFTFVSSRLLGRHRTKPLW